MQATEASGCSLKKLTALISNSYVTDNKANHFLSYMKSVYKQCIYCR